ncbi:hypothetical protein C0993_004555 [Termitomyces sp. T159_Od127]|nr:hypothetical protein C0993_004555 [Termitomyces sp. T159_Od127]
MSSSPRISLAGYLGTVRYTGPVEGTSGTWLGVEWDDHARGKHDGVKDGRRYFTCRIQNSASFIRPSPNVSYGQSFLEALTSKYIETPHGSASQESVILGSSQGSIVVEAVNLDKIRGKLADLGKLREVSLVNLDVATGDADGLIQETCPSKLYLKNICHVHHSVPDIRGLDLSKSLIPDWGVVALITRELPLLKRLCLNSNRLLPAKNFTDMESAFANLTELQLNNTMMSWSEMQNATAKMRNLEIIEFGYNSLTRLKTGDDVLPVNKTVRVLNLDSNTCFDWVHIWESICHYTSLQRLLLASNAINSVPSPGPQQGLPALKHLSLLDNKIQAWSDIDALSSWCPALEGLTLRGNPLTAQIRHSRPFTISKLPTLMILDGGEITYRERIDSEILYLDSVVSETVSENERIKAHPQWLNLCKKHGRPDFTTKANPVQDKLSQHLIALDLYQSLSLTASDYQEVMESQTPLVLRVLPTMTLRALRRKTCKTFKVKANVLLWILQTGGALAELRMEHDDRTLAWLGLDEGSKVILCIMEA